VPRCYHLAYTKVSQNLQQKVCTRGRSSTTVIYFAISQFQSVYMSF
jgi:hypothetical protein